MDRVFSPFTVFFISFHLCRGGGIPPVLKAYSELGDHSRRCSLDDVGDRD